MRIVVFSDNHGHIDFPVPDGDVLVVAGDISSGRGRTDELIKFDAFVSKLPHKTKLLVAGNHDCIIERDRSVAKLYVPTMTYLEDQELVVDGIKFYCSPYVPIFGSWSFMLSGQKLKSKWDLVPADTDVLITHGPPYGILDRVSFSGECAGDVGLLAAVNKLDHLRLHCYGHIHQSKGQVRQLTTGPTTFANVSLCDDDYNLVNAPMVFDL
jgi:Icc-related predicted phosphoesterase